MMMKGFNLMLMTQKCTSFLLSQRVVSFVHWDVLLVFPVGVDSVRAE